MCSSDLVDERVAQGDEGVDGAQREPVEREGSEVVRQAVKAGVDLGLLHDRRGAQVAPPVQSDSLFPVVAQDVGVVVAPATVVVVGGTAAWIVSPGAILPSFTWKTKNCVEAMSPFG